MVHVYNYKNIEYQLLLEQSYGGKVKGEIVFPYPESLMSQLYANKLKGLSDEQVYDSLKVKKVLLSEEEYGRIGTLYEEAKSLRLPIVPIARATLHATHVKLWSQARHDSLKMHCTLLGEESKRYKGLRQWMDSVEELRREVISELER
jgi:hypothetical protein